MKKLNIQQENLYLGGIIGSENLNKLLKTAIKKGVTKEVNIESVAKPILSLLKKAK